jgi:hypothetical protein
MLTALERNSGNFVSIGQIEPPYEPIASIIIVLSVLILMAVLSSVMC